MKSKSFWCSLWSTDNKGTEEPNINRWLVSEKPNNQIFVSILNAFKLN